MPKPGRKRVRVLWKVIALVLTAMVGSFFGGTPVHAEDTRWAVYAGRWGVGKTGETSELGFEGRRRVDFHDLDLVGGLAGTADEALWVYAGASLGWVLSDRWEVRPGFAISFFDEGDGKDLGGPIEFRSSLELAYGLRSDLRVGLLVYHLSNAGFYDLNPGANSVVLTIGFQ